MRFLVLLFLGCSAIFGWSWVSFWSTSNCGGNSAALSTVHLLALTARVASHDAPDHAFRFTEPSAEVRDAIGQHARSSWIKPANFWVSTERVLENDPVPRRVIVVCDRPFRNVPKRYLGAPPMHAASFADGTSGLISPEEFAALDRTKFVTLDTLVPPKGKAEK